jgi:hypothetical protein
VRRLPLNALRARCTYAARVLDDSSRSFLLRTSFWEFCRRRGSTTGSVHAEQTAQPEGPQGTSSQARQGKRSLHHLGNGRSPLHHHQGRTRGLPSPYHQRINISRSSGAGAIPIQILPKTPTARNTIAASPTPTNASHPASRAGKPTAATSIFSGARPMKSIRILQAALTIVRLSRAEDRRRPIRGNCGAIGTSKTSATTSSWNLSIRAGQANSI